jgi:hypothetical protein
MGAFSNICNRVHFEFHGALAGSAHRNARWTPVVDGIG